ncbi:hypothetical protein HBB16_05485 [Pseudonocardia sp. MCCB 268]|nr:hypothetical protein [Pseudonocardia cytotoxica]
MWSPTGATAGRRGDRRRVSHSPGVLAGRSGSARRTAVVGNIHLRRRRPRPTRWQGRRPGRGAIFSFGNYAGDVMNFGIAVERLRAEGIDAWIAIVTDDVASADTEEAPRHRRRLHGVQGDGRGRRTGPGIDEVERVGRAANAATRTLGVVLRTMPGE